MSLGHGIHHKKQMLNLCARFPLRDARRENHFGIQVLDPEICLFESTYFVQV